MSDFISKVKLFNELAGNKNQFDKKMISLYIGLILEETGELMESIKSTAPMDGVAFEMMAQSLHELADLFKKADFEVEQMIIDRVAFLDAAMDIMVVSCGAGIASGADVDGAANEVMDSNLTKFPLDAEGNHTVIKDENGKVQKPESYRKPELERFIQKD
jgi:predicted HAD superfamily Cof-like phosphohydrolase